MEESNLLDVIISDGNTIDNTLEALTFLSYEKLNGETTRSDINMVIGLIDAISYMAHKHSEDLEEYDNRISQKKHENIADKANVS